MSDEVTPILGTPLVAVASATLPSEGIRTAPTL
jgi:hypothetical protein